MIGVALLAILALQDTSTVLSPRVRAMLGEFPPPRPGEPSIAIGFSADTAWVGEQVELVTATWFPRALRDRLRHEPTIRAPSLSGLWSAQNQLFPVPVLTRYVGKQLYDLYIAYQTIFPLAPGRIDAPAAALAFSVPTSSSYFAPEDRKTYTSAPSHLVVRAIPAGILSGLGTGPTARDMRLVWRGPSGSLTAGAPAVVELAVSGDGNLTLWPAPAIAWPPGLHVYPEPTIERTTPVQGWIAGEKRFRFTLVVDSGGVVTLPAMRYPYFDPMSRSLQIAEAHALELPVLAPRTAAQRHELLPVTAYPEIPVATVLVHQWWPALLLVMIVPLVGVAARRRTAGAVARPVVMGSPEAQLRAALGTPVAAGPEHVVSVLRRRGVARDDAEQVRRWLHASSRWRYGPAGGDGAPPPAVVDRVLKRLRPAVIVTLLLLARPLRGDVQDGLSRYRGGDYAGAAREFAAAAQREPDAAGLWRNLGAARWMSGDDVAAAAAWLQAIILAPRDGEVRAAWRAVNPPADVRDLAPTFPVSRDELIVIAVACWCAAWTLLLLGRRVPGLLLGVGCGAAAIVAGARAAASYRHEALIIANVAPHISPHPATMAFEMLPPWTIVRIERSRTDWVLVTAQVPGAASLVTKVVTGWLPAGAVAPIGPLD